MRKGKSVCKDLRLGYIVSAYHKNRPTKKRPFIVCVFIMSEILKAKIDLLINILSGLQMGLIVKHQADFNRIRYGDVRNCGQLRKKMKSAGWALQSPISYENSDARVGKSFCDFAAKQMDPLLICVGKKAQVVENLDSRYIQEGWLILTWNDIFHAVIVDKREPVNGRALPNVFQWKRGWTKIWC